MWQYVTPGVVVLIAEVPIIALVLRRVRRVVQRELAQRVVEGDIIAGVPANWLKAIRGMRWSGCLTLTSVGTLRWEPDRASRRSRRATPQEWDVATLRIEVLRRRRVWTGEWCEVLRLTANEVSVARFVVFGEVGPWHQRLAGGMHPTPEQPHR